jgi:hypothetical protein
MLGAIRFLWNATRGHRLTPWRSEYLKWRIETYSGKRADTIDDDAFWQFVYEQKWQFLRFLHWTSKMRGWEHTRPKAH